MTPLAEHLLRRIAATGPMTIAEYMGECLMHPDLGYYTTREPFGAAGDFTTSPEISQMFGELIGICLAQSWLDQGAPAPFTLAELGPGRGTLMSDALRATRAVPGFHDAARVHLIEASPKLQQIQHATLNGIAVQWHREVADLPNAPLFLIANEFFDALPIRQFQRSGEHWRERQVGAKDGALTMGLSSAAPLANLDHRLADTKDDDVVEVSAQVAPIAAEVADRISQHGGAALVVDYGDWRSVGDTLQALKDHRRTDPLGRPGQADLTAHVDFEVIAQTALESGVKHTKLTPQGVFLERLGITERAQALARSLQGDGLSTHVAAHRRLTHPEEMGSLFKVLGLYSQDGPPPPGLEP